MTHMPTLSTADRKALLERKAAAILQELSRLEDMPEDNFKNGDVLRFEKVYETNDKTYTFVFLKAAGFWYGTGIFQDHKWTWDYLVQWATPEVIRTAQRATTYKKAFPS